MRSCTLMIGLVLTGACVAADDKPVKLPPAFEAAKKEFKTAVGRAEADYNKAVQKAAEDYKAKLKAVQETETKAGNLDTALAVRDEIKALTDDSLPLFDDSKEKELTAMKGKVVVGTWDVTVTPGRTTRTYLLKADGELLSVEDKKTWKLKKVGDSLLADTVDGRISRFTFASGRLFEEMYESKTNLEKDLPQFIGIGVLKKK